MKHILLTALLATGCQSTMEAVLLPQRVAERECTLRNDYSVIWDGKACVPSNEYYAKVSVGGPSSEPPPLTPEEQQRMQWMENVYGPQKYSGEYWAAVHLGVAPHVPYAPVSQPPPLYAWPAAAR